MPQPSPAQLRLLSAIALNRFEATGQTQRTLTSLQKAGWVADDVTLLKAGRHRLLLDAWNTLVQVPRDWSPVSQKVAQDQLQMLVLQQLGLVQLERRADGKLLWRTAVNLASVTSAEKWYVLRAPAEWEAVGIVNLLSSPKGHPTLVRKGLIAFSEVHVPGYKPRVEWRRGPRWARSSDSASPAH